MAMTKEQKTAAVDELVGKLEAAPTVYLTDYSGLTVSQANDLRGQFRASGVEFKVVKNTLLKLAMDKVGGYEELIDYLSGPTAIAFTEEPAAPAKVIKKFVKAEKTDNPSLKGANVEGAIYHEGALGILADLKSKDELLGDIVGLLMAPMSNVVGAIQSPATTIAGIIKVLAEREEEVTVAPVEEASEPKEEAEAEPVADASEPKEEAAADPEEEKSSEPEEEA